MKISKEKLSQAGKKLQSDSDKEIEKIGRLLERNASALAMLMTKYAGFLE